MKYFTVTIDVERDCGPGWRGSNPVTYRSVTQAIPRMIQPLCDAVGLQPVYLISAEILEHPPCVAVLRELKNKAELGTHLHGEFVEPQKTFRGIPYDRTYTGELQSLYPPALEFEKLKTLTQLFKETLLSDPYSFRSGRFALGAHTLKHLANLGYLVDTSVTPGILWEYENGTVDYRAYTPGISWHSRSAQQNQILEVPVTIHPRWGWLRPSKNTTANMLHILEDDRQESSISILNLMFHSMEYIPGASPYAQTQEDCERLLDSFRQTLEKALEMGYRFVSLRQLYRELRKKADEK